MQIRVHRNERRCRSAGPYRGIQVFTVILASKQRKAYVRCDYLHRTEFGYCDRSSLQKSSSSCGRSRFCKGRGYRRMGLSSEGENVTRQPIPIVVDLNVEVEQSHRNNVLSLSLSASFWYVQASKLLFSAAICEY